MVIAFLLLSATGYAQNEGTLESSIFSGSRSKQTLAWRSGAPDLEKPKKADLKNTTHSTIDIRSIKEDLKGIGVYSFTSGASSRLSVQLNDYADQSLLIQLVDKNGKVMHSQFLLVDKNDEDYTLDISSFNEVHYKLVISNVKEKRMSIYILERDKKI